MNHVTPRHSEYHAQPIPRAKSNPLDLPNAVLLAVLLSASSVWLWTAMRPLFGMAAWPWLLFAVIPFVLLFHTRR